MHTRKYLTELLNSNQEQSSIFFITVTSSQYQQKFKHLTIQGYQHTELPVCNTRQNMEKTISMG